MCVIDGKSFASQDAKLFPATTKDIFKKVFKQKNSQIKKELYQSWFPKQLLTQTSVTESLKVHR